MALFSYLQGLNYFSEISKVRGKVKLFLVDREKPKKLYRGEEKRGKMNQADGETLGMN